MSFSTSMATRAGGPDLNPYLYSELSLWWASCLLDSVFWALGAKNGQSRFHLW